MSLRMGRCVQCGKARNDLDSDGCCSPCLIKLCDEVLEGLRKLPPGVEVPALLPGVMVTEADLDVEHDPASEHDRRLDELRRAMRRGLGT